MIDDENAHHTEQTRVKMKTNYNLSVDD